MGNMTSHLQTTNGRTLSTKQEVANLAKMLNSHRLMCKEEHFMEPALSTRAVSKFSNDSFGL